MNVPAQPGQPAQGQPGGQNVQPAPGQQPPNPMTALAQNVSPEYASTVNGTLAKIYQDLDRNSGVFSHPRDGGPPISYQEFLQNMAGKTNGFDPALMSKVLFPDPSERASFMSSLQQVNQLRGINTNALIQPVGLNQQLFTSNDFLGKMLNADYLNTKSRLGVLMSRNNDQSAMNDIYKQIDDLHFQNMDQATKERTLAQLIQNALKVDMSQVHRLGLDKGTILESLPQ
jgi:hypothetical protein